MSRRMRASWCLAAAGALWAGAVRAEDGAVPMSHFVQLKVQAGLLVGELTSVDTGPGAPVAAGAAGAITRQVVKVAGVESAVTVQRRATTLSASWTNGKETSSMTVSPAVISMTRSTTDANGLISRVTFQQRRTAAGAANQSAVMLTVTVSNVNGGQQVAQRFNEATFGDLTAKHPEAAAMYLEPLFRGLGLSSVLEVTLDDARAVFAQLAAAQGADQAAMQARVDALVKRLSAESWKEREAARNELMSLGKAAAAILRELRGKDLPVEAADAVRAALEASDDPRLSDPDFMLRCVGLDDAKIAAQAAREYGKLTGKKLEIDLTLPAKERAAAVEKLRMGG